MKQLKASKLIEYLDKTNTIKNNLDFTQYKDIEIHFHNTPVEINIKNNIRDFQYPLGFKHSDVAQTGIESLRDEQKKRKRK